MQTEFELLESPGEPLRAMEIEYLGTEARSGGLERRSAPSQQGHSRRDETARISDEPYLANDCTYSFQISRNANPVKAP